MVTSQFQLSMEWSKYKYIIFYRNKSCKDCIGTGEITANHKESNVYIRNLPLNEISLLYHYRSCNFAHCPPFCTIRQLTYIDCELITAKMNRHLTLVYKGYLTTHFPRGEQKCPSHLLPKLKPESHVNTTIGRWVGVYPIFGNNYFWVMTSQPYWGKTISVL